MDCKIQIGSGMCEFVEQPIDGFLDLHAFQPSEVKSLIPDYLQECRSQGVLQVRIVHGKGTGALRTLVHNLLDRIPFIESYQFSPEGNWGATTVTLCPLSAEPASGDDISGKGGTSIQ